MRIELLDRLGNFHIDCKPLKKGDVFFYSSYQDQFIQVLQLSRNPIQSSELCNMNMIVINIPSHIPKIFYSAVV